MALPGLGRRWLRAAVTTWALVGLLWCATTGLSGHPDGLLLPTVLAIIATTAVCLLLRHSFSTAYAAVGPLGPVAERSRSTLVAWVGDPNIPGKPQQRAPGAGPSLR